MTEAIRWRSRSSQGRITGEFAPGGGSYVKVPSSADVFTTTGRLAYLVKRDVNGWRKRPVVSLEPDDLTGLTLRQASGELWGGREPLG